MATAIMTDILQMTPAERLELIGEIWDSLSSSPESIPLTEAQKAELDRRLEAHRLNPETISWEEAKARLRRNKRLHQCVSAKRR